MNDDLTKIEGRISTLESLFKDDAVIHNLSYAYQFIEELETLLSKYSDLHISSLCNMCLKTDENIITYLGNDINRTSISDWLKYNDLYKQ